MITLYMLQLSAHGEQPSQPTQEVYQPKATPLIIVKSRISEASWQRRVEAARKAELIVKDIEFRVNFGLSLNQAIKSSLPKEKRSWAIRAVTSYRQGGFESLIDTRVPKTPRFSRNCLDIIQAARLANPKISVEQVLEILQDRKVGQLPGESTIKREMRKVDDRRRYAEKKQKQQQPVIEELPMAGGELLLAAELETGLMAEVTKEIETLGTEAKEASGERQPQRDVKHRDRRGRFTAAYNQARKRKPGEQVASYLRPAEEKAADKVPTWARFVYEKRPSLERKVRTLTFEPMVNKSHGWDGLRTEAVGQGLKPLVGIAYQPSTLAKFTSALSQSGAGPRLLRVVGRHWHGVTQQRWGEPGGAAALFIDNHVKEVWSSLFTCAGKVSHRSRVMPAITTTYVHTGAGTPVVVALQSGSAPLSPQLFDLVAQAEEALDEEIQRLVVIDAEGSVFDILESFKNNQRVIVTPLRSNQLQSLELHYGPGSYFRPFREHDELRVAQATLHHKSTGRSLELDALIVRRKNRNSQQILLSTGSEFGVPGRVAAEAYYRRWPVQENGFKQGAAAVKLNHHRGNSGTIVTNVTVVNKLEKLEGQLVNAEKRLGKVNAARESLKQDADKARCEQKQAGQELRSSRKQLDELRADDQCPAPKLAEAAIGLQEAMSREEASRQALVQAEEQMANNEAKRFDLLSLIESLSTRVSELEPLQKIRQLDVALDSVMTAFKLVASMLILFVLREYLCSRPMTHETFVSRVLSIRGRRELSDEHEHIVFYENARDPEMSEALRHACKELNSRKLVRDDRLLHYRVEKPP